MLIKTQALTLPFFLLLHPSSVYATALNKQLLSAGIDLFTTEPKSKEEVISDGLGGILLYCSGVGFFGVSTSISEDSSMIKDSPFEIFKSDSFLSSFPFSIAFGGYPTFTKVKNIENYL